MMKLPICLVEGQGYQHKSKELSPEQYTYIAWDTHSLYLAVEDICRSIKTMRDMFDTVIAMSKIFK